MGAKRADLQGLPYWPRLLSRDQAAAYIGLSAPSLDGLSISCMRIKGRVLYDRFALDRWIDGQQKPGTSDEDVAAALRALD